MSSASRVRASLALLPIVLSAAALARCSSSPALPGSEPAAEPGGGSGAKAPGPRSRHRRPGTPGGPSADGGLDAATDATLLDASPDAATDSTVGDAAPLDATLPDATLDAPSDASSDVTGFDGPGFDGPGFDAPPGFDASAYGAWSAFNNSPPFAPGGGLLLTDGTVMFHDSQEQTKWWRLTPDNTGSYLNGTWSPRADLPPGYEPLYFASAVLADGRVVVIGGEYDEGMEVETDLGAIYDPTVDVWTPLQAPNPLSTWRIVGDTQSVVLPDGRMMIASIESTQVALFDPRTLTWTTLGGPGPDGGLGKADVNSEEGWTLLPNGKVLTMDVGVYTYTATKNSELFDPSTLTWSGAGNVGVQLSDPNTFEIGPAVLMPTGKVFATGATGNTAVYDSVAGTWAPGPSFPLGAGGQQLDIADGPAALLPNGNVLCAASPGAYNQGTEFFEFDGTNLTEVAPTVYAPVESSYYIFFVLLPTGQVVAADNSGFPEVYAGTGAPQAAWAPTITTSPGTVVRGTTYKLEGTQFNGLSQAVAYGDDYQSATNYPLVRITNDATGHVFYGRTHDHSTMAVATGSAPVYTLFEASAATETGASHLVVVANGIASTAVPVTIQ
jgi:hypothetical protein